MGRPVAGGKTEASALLRVAEAFQQDIGLGVARLDSATRKALGVHLGDIVEIQGRKQTGAVVSRSQADDEGKALVRVEAVVRRNAGVAIGDRVSVQRAAAPEAQSMTIAPIYSGSARMDLSTGLDTFISKALQKRPFNRGDVFVIPGVFLQGGSLPFMVVSTQPKGIVQVAPTTVFTIREETVAEDQVRALPSYDDIGGQREVLRQVRELIELPLAHPELFVRAATKAPAGILLFGPPGTGKTLIAGAVAGETGVHYVSIPGPEYMSAGTEKTEEDLRKAFDDAKSHAPTVVFIDEVDALAPRRDSPTCGEHERRVVAQLLTLIDGPEDRGNVVVIGATNRIDSVDPALRRPGRFDREIEVPLPTNEGRKEILRIRLRGVPLESDEEGREDLIKYLADHTDRFSAADLAALVREACMRAIARFKDKHEAEMQKLPMDPNILNQLIILKDDFIETLLRFVPSSHRGPRF